jgi:zeaxanthin glucosyltransferase
MGPAGWPGCLSGRQGLRFSVAYFRREQAMLHGELPAALQAANINVLLVDQLSPAASTAAERLGLPFVTIANALPVNREPALPPYFTGWLPSSTPWARWRNQLGNTLLDRLTEPLWRDLQEQRRSCGLPPRRYKEEALSPLLQLAPHFHYVGRLAMMLQNPRYRAAALHLQAEGKAAGGVVRAADLIARI